MVESIHCWAHGCCWRTFAVLWISMSGRCSRSQPTFAGDLPFEHAAPHVALRHPTWMKPLRPLEPVVVGMADTVFYYTPTARMTSIHWFRRTATHVAW